LRFFSWLPGSWTPAGSSGRGRSSVANLASYSISATPAGSSGRGPRTRQPMKKAQLQKAPREGFARSSLALRAGVAFHCYPNPGKYHLVLVIPCAHRQRSCFRKRGWRSPLAARRARRNCDRRYIGSCRPGEGTSFGGPTATGYPCRCPWRCNARWT
jgi:hypothetical protein